MFKKIFFSFFIISLLFTLSACGKEENNEAESSIINGQVSQEKMEAVANQQATFTPEELEILKAQEKQTEIETYNLKTEEEIAQHNTKADCWLVIYDKVYDVTNYINSHPGGPVIADSCGKDATELFDAKPNTGQPHSDKAKEMLEKYYIADKYLGE